MVSINFKLRRLNKIKFRWWKKTCNIIIITWWTVKKATTLNSQPNVKMMIQLSTPLLYLVTEIKINQYLNIVQDKESNTAANNCNNQNNFSFSGSSWNSWSDKHLLETSTTTTTTTTTVTSPTKPTQPLKSAAASAPLSCFASASFKTKCKDARRRVHF